MSAAFDLAAERGVVHVIASERADDALGLADALLAGGLPITDKARRAVAPARDIRDTKP